MAEELPDELVELFQDATENGVSVTRTPASSGPALRIQKRDITPTRASFIRQTGQKALQMGYALTGMRDKGDHLMVWFDEITVTTARDEL